MNSGKVLLMNEKWKALFIKEISTINHKTLLFWNFHIYLDYHVNENGKHKWYLLPNFHITLSQLPHSIHLKLDGNVKKIIGFFPFSLFCFQNWDILRELFINIARGSIPISVLQISGPRIKRNLKNILSHGTSFGLKLLEWLKLFFFVVVAETVYAQGDP